MNSNIIGLAGRISSGKRVICDVFEEFGYARLYFAYPLKKLISELLSKSIEELDSLKNVESEYKFQKNELMHISNVTNIPYKVVEDVVGNRSFKTVRELYVVIGTDLIRNYDKDWHVNEIRKLIKSDKKYCIDDVRFPNEVELINELGGDIWYVVRPKIDLVLNHESETSLCWQYFGDRVIVNKGTKEELEDSIRKFMEGGYEYMMNKRNEFITLNKMPNNELLIHGDYIDYAPIDFSFSEITSYGMSGNTLSISFENGTSMRLNNALNIEDAKFYL